MEKINCKLKVCYAQKLSAHHRERYLEKLASINGFDPYESSKRVWNADPTLLPPTTYMDIVDYLVYGISFYTSEQFKSHKGLEAYKQFCDGWVHDLQTFKPQNCDNTVVLAQVMHSQKMSEKPLSAWVILAPNGQVKTGHCTCMAGLAETCTHVSALLFKVETVVRLRERTTVTGVAAYWMIPGNVTHIKPQVGYEIDFTSSESKKKQLDKRISGPVTLSATVPIQRTCKSRTTVVPVLTADKLARFMKDLHATGDNAAILAVTPQYSHLFKDPIEPVVLPSSLKNLMSNQYDGADIAELTLYCESQKSKINITKEQADLVERHTRKQDKSSAWFSLRAGRITASKLHSVVHTNVQKPSVTVIRQVCYPERSKITSTLPAPQWGITHEKAARQRYLRESELEHADLCVKECGFFINPKFPYLGASPDGRIECICCGVGVLEVKCPYKHRCSTLMDASKDPTFFLHTVNGELQIKENHPYYSQVQCQIFVTESAFCDLSIMTEADFHIIRILPNEQFWDTCRQKSEIFFFKVVLPELVAQHFTAKHSKQPLTLAQQKEVKSKKGKSSKCSKKTESWCYCLKGEDFDDMVACDSENCRIQWFHLSCVGLDKCPSDDDFWLCPTCQNKAE